jgi:sarcosine oxidase subunit alpha
MRIETGVTRGPPVRIEVDAISVESFAGETVATALLASGRSRFRDDLSGHSRGLFCNMGTCSECTVWAAGADGRWRRVRACLVPVEAGMVIRTQEARPDAR